MRKFTLMFVALFVATMTFAQKTWKPQMLQKTLTPAKEVFAASPRNAHKKVTKTASAKVGYVSKRKVASAEELEGPAVILNETWYDDPASGGNSVTIKKSEGKDNEILIYNLVPDATEPIYAEVDFESGTVSIEPGQVLFTHETYGDIVFAAIDKGVTDDIVPDFDAMIEGTIDEDGVIVIGNWSDFLIEGEYAGHYWDDAYYESTIYPANGKMECNIYASDNAVSWNVVMFQNTDTVTVYNFGNYGQPIDIIIKKDSTIEIPSQLVYDIFQRQTNPTEDYYTYPINWSTMQITSYNIYGEATEDEITFGNWVMFSMSGYFTGDKFADAKIYYIDGGKFKFDEFTEEIPDEVVIAPEGLETEDYLFKATNKAGQEEASVMLPVKVGFDGDDVYVQGLCSYLPEAWVKGTLEDGVATFATGQYFGKRQTYDFYFVGGDTLTTSISDVQFEYDEEAGVFATDNAIFISLKKKEVNYVGYFVDITIEKVTDVPATPADPEITGFAPYDKTVGYGSINFILPLESVEGENLHADKLYYVIYTKSVVDNTVAPYVFTSDLYIKIEENMTYVPYTFNDDLDFNEFQGIKFVYLNFPTSDYKAFGVQAFYLGGGETNASELVWKENPETTGISAATAGSVAKVSYTDLSGRAVAQPTHGLYIMTMKMADGTKKSVKMLIK